MASSELVGHFVNATFEFLTMEIGVQTTKGTTLAFYTEGTSHDVNIIIEIDGVVSGHIIYGLSISMARSVAEAMLGRQIKSLDGNAQSALLELGNMISGMAISRFDDKYSDVMLTAPVFVVGKNIYIAGNEIGYSHTSLKSDIGDMSLTVALQVKTTNQVIAA